ncbi:MAG: hypothetical protein MUC57_12475, partial [Desulfobacterales bacterium]|nr:hypothetical protein [Desulfobacterales bacterium]
MPRLPAPFIDALPRRVLWGWGAEEPPGTQPPGDAVSRSKLIPLPDAVERFVPDGSSVAAG